MRHVRIYYVILMRSNSVGLGQCSFHQKAGLAHVQLAAVARFEFGHDLAHILDAARAEFGLDRCDRG